MSVVKEIPFFSLLTEEELNLIDEIASETEFKKGEYIFFEGEAGDKFFIIKNGQVKLTKMIKNGDEQILNIFSDHDIIAEIVAFDKGNYPASAITMTDTEVIVFDQSELESLILNHPSIGVKLLREMSGRLRRAQQNVRDLALKDSSARVAGLLIFLAEKYGKKNKDRVILDISLTQQELASMIGSSRETVSRVLGQFESEDLIKTSRKKIIIYKLDQIKLYT
ncbi:MULTISPECIES: Crp/Fnr family transcriptional regulator [Halanaerobium]|jgi:CRP/FNR family transcriptional regulator|uniref:CRP/FNR family transcriptional regulator, anaerobic regulatory protein n=1 Tax=Halanaerobium kushneri TaxID=56779 RepID=A0A1N6TRF0_9FIRM|nr:MULTISPECIES: Crp/Fnr family transcriptional regulator [Halanaerobium]RCW53322.1 CRP/FNR family transcriptional regulator [Halanaerobium sp. ST460_2HS_T2]SIQ55921.1 CRP/FNR family transcriptional regulator, anaerobic regulatory protein [Halanaerobium kushneri]